MSGKRKGKKTVFLKEIYITYDSGSGKERILIAHENIEDAANTAGDKAQCAMYQLVSVGTLHLHASLEEEKQI